MNIDKILEKAGGKDPYIKDVFSILSRSAKGEIAGDSAPISHSIEDIDEMKDVMFNHMKGRYIKNGVSFQSYDEMKKQVTQVVGDEFYNEATGVGTLTDPQAFSKASVPVMLGPMEQSALYSNGGIAAIIIDKKAKGMVSTGITFKAYEEKLWGNDKIKMLEEAANITGCNTSLIETLRDGLIFGGSVQHPVFKKEKKGDRLKSLDELVLEKGCIDRWVSADRWNIVYVPSYDVTAEDYLRPETIYFPLGGYEISTRRCSLLRPKTMPYWAVLYNLGWSPSDYSGYARALYAYTMVSMAVPIMAQQMSLLLYQMPLDAIAAQMGPETVKKLMAVNEEKMKEWSVLNPKAVNIVGELKVVDRNFSGFDHFLGSVKSDLAAQCGIAEPVLFHTPNKGFSDNTTEALLKDSEMMRLLQIGTETQLTCITDALIAHTWGTDSEEWKNRRKVRMSFDKPIVSTEKDLAEVGARFAATVASLVQANVPADEAIKLASQFFKTVEVTEDIIEAVRKEVERMHKMEEKGLEAKKDAGGPGHTMASPGSAGNTGKFTKPS
jgi:hypothetical protein